MNIEPFIRPSSTDENALCPARPAMQAKVVELVGEPAPTDEANLGHRAHSWGETGVRLLAQDESFELLDEIADIESVIAALRDAHQKEDRDYQLDPWTLSVVERYVRYVHALIVKHDIKPEHVLVEEKLDMVDLGFVNKGTADCVLVVPFKLVIVIDFKAGFVDQGDAVDHGQITAYGAAAAIRFKADYVEVRIAQPRAEKEHRFTGAIFDAPALEQAAAWIRSVNDACRAPNPQLNASFTACSNCKALRLCPAAQEYIVRTLEAFDIIGTPDSPEAWGELIGAAKLAEKRAEQVKDMGKAHIAGGGVALGFKLGAGRAIKTVTQVPAAIQKLEAAGLGAAAMAAVSMSISKLPPEAADLIAEFVTEKVSEPSLVADKRTKAVA